VIHSTPSLEATLLDLRGLKCPMPILKSKKALAKLGPDALLRVWATDPNASVDFARFCAQTGHQLQSERFIEEGAYYEFILRHK